MTKANSRATVVRDDGKEEDWGFFDVRVMGGTLLFRTSTETPRGQYDHFLAAGTWREVRDIYTEEVP